jgi:hypothetical protein
MSIQRKSAHCARVDRSSGKEAKKKKGKKGEKYPRNNPLIWRVGSNVTPCDSLVKTFPRSFSEEAELSFGEHWENKSLFLH